MPAHRQSAGAVAALLVSLLAPACATPPDKEINQAQGAMEAARAAGAEQYAAEEYAAASAALDRSLGLVAQHDYKQALSQALDAREGAKEAARRAAQQRAATRSAAELRLTDVTAAVQQARGAITAAQAARVPAKDIAALQTLVTRAENALQEARAAISRDEYQGAVTSLEGRASALESATQTLSDASAARQPRRRR